MDVTDPVVADTNATYTAGISERRGGASKFYHADRMGTNTAETDSTQTITSDKVYDAFGLLVTSTGASSSPFGYVGGQGYQEDGDSGLRLLGHRYYDPSIGRFLTRDPAKAGKNWYDYAGNNPIRKTDPTGEDFLDWFRLALAIWQSTYGSSLGWMPLDPPVDHPVIRQPFHERAEVEDPEQYEEGKNGKGVLEDAGIGEEKGAGGGSGEGGGPGVGSEGGEVDGALAVETEVAVAGDAAAAGEGALTGVEVIEVVAIIIVL